MCVTNTSHNNNYNKEILTEFLKMRKHNLMSLKIQTSTNVYHVKVTARSHVRKRFVEKRSTFVLQKRPNESRIRNLT